MPRGGLRPGAGRKPGSLTRRTREIAEQAAGDGITPLEYMLTVMRDSDEPPERRDEMAKAAAPCMHPRLASVEQQISGKDGDPLKMLLQQIDGNPRGLPSPRVSS